ncbi:hypothetical protein POM88_053034 [Heracleum sosnowskyi]|uniref:Uncharacterized protein n=1 Tax=Heracleum sosnowskyi TaxID=360622 RepID=A0AAD8GR62_9APIA|nr:hypothetical protein POM88_053034 [Heracleum sosnowskyi]
MTTRRELVICLNRDGHVLRRGIHGYWVCNIVNSQYVVHLVNKGPHGSKFSLSIKNGVTRLVNKMTDDKLLLWTPPEQEPGVTTVTNHLVQQTLKHNVYRGTFHRPDWIPEAEAVAVQFTDIFSPQNLTFFLEQFVGATDMSVVDLIKRKTGSGYCHRIHV